MTRIYKTAALAIIACALVQTAAISRPAPQPQLPPLSPPYVAPTQAPGVIPPPTVNPQPGRTERCVHQAGGVPATQRATFIHRCING